MGDRKKAKANSEKGGKKSGKKSATNKPKC